MDEQVVEEIAEILAQQVAGGASLEGAMRLQRFVPPEILAEAAKRYRDRVGQIIEMKDPGALVERELIDGAWYSGPQAEHKYWPNLKGALLGSLPDEAVQGVSNSAQRVVGLLRPPGAEQIRTRGLVLGHVQSGKTTSFQSVAAMAVDAGYRFVIVLSGITENLRVQSQQRLDEQLVGDLSNKWVRLTSVDSDFASQGNAAALMSNPQHRLLAVVKKNPARLRHLAEWIESAGDAAQRSCPILVIDDEADQASLDVGKQRRSTINGLIRRILGVPKAAYVAYTATPFANVLINPSDVEGLYPRHFIVPLSPGGGYYGPERLFGRDLVENIEGDEVDDPDDVIRYVPEHDFESVQPPKGKGAVHTWEPALAPSLRTAVLWFLLATAARRARGQVAAHSSMLVHTSMLADAHFKLQAVVQEFVGIVRSGVMTREESMLGEFRALWEEEKDKVAPGEGETTVGWEDVEGLLPVVLAELQLVSDNYLSTERLIYTAGVPATVIAIGGNTLSRGLTLEGLVCSYFVRAASAYDTLLQMGRWFGYRRGYADLVRIWMSNELAGWFADLATVEAEIRHEIGRYELEGLTPSQLAVKVRTHPAMSVTSAAKMAGAVRATADYSGKREQTILFKHRDEEWLAANWLAAKNLLAHASNAPGVERATNPAGHAVLKAVPAELVAAFLDEYRFHEDSRRLNPGLMQAYIKKETARGALTSWNVVVAAPPVAEKAGGDGVLAADLGILGKVGLGARAKMALGSDATTANIKALAGSKDKALDMNPQDRAELPDDVSDAQLVRTRKELGLGPLLVLFPIAPNAPVVKRMTKAGKLSEARVPLDAVVPVMGAVFHFPESDDVNSGVSYISAALPPDVEIEEVDVEAELAAIDGADTITLEEDS